MIKITRGEIRGIPMDPLCECADVQIVNVSEDVQHELCSGFICVETGEYEYLCSQCRALNTK